MKPLFLLILIGVLPSEQAKLVTPSVHDSLELCQAEAETYRAAATEQRVFKSFYWKCQNISRTITENWK